MKKWPIGIGLYSVHKYLFEDWKSTLKKIKDIGYEGVEFFGPFNYDPTDFKNYLDQLDLKLIGWHIGWDGMQPDTIDATIQNLNNFGAKIAILPYLDPKLGEVDGRSGKQAWKYLVDQMAVACKKFNDAGIQFGYHNHAYEFLMEFENKNGHDIIFDILPKNAIVQLDTGTVLEARHDPIKYLKKYEDHPISLHCKPYSYEKGLEVEVGADDDDHDWKAILNQCQNNNMEWTIIECEAETIDEIEAAKTSFNNFKRIMDTI